MWQRWMLLILGGMISFSSLAKVDNICQYFPGPAQSWEENSGAFFGSNQNGKEPTPYYIGGWPESYTKEYESPAIFGEDKEKYYQSLSIGLLHHKH